MPVFNLGPLGSFQLTRVTKESSTAAANKIAVQRYGAPPSYCIEIEPFYLEALRGPLKTQPSPCTKQQLRRYVLEIIAITFNANFDKLNTAALAQSLSPDGEGGTSLRMRDLRQLDAEVEAHKARLEVRRRAV